jgi:hypothetical protein
MVILLTPPAPNTSEIVNTVFSGLKVMQSELMIKQPHIAGIIVKNPNCQDGRHNYFIYSAVLQTPFMHNVEASTNCIIC